MESTKNVPVDKHSSKETINYCRIILLIIDVGTETLLHLFYSLVPKHTVKDYFASKKVQIDEGRWKNIIDNRQYAKLTCPEPNPDEFDLCLLIKLLTYFTPSPVHLDRLQIIRNEIIGRKYRAELITLQFESRWVEVENILLNIAKNVSGEEEEITKAKIVELKHKVLDVADTEIQISDSEIPPEKENTENVPIDKHSSKETTNYCRIILLIIDVGTETLLHLFYSRVPRHTVKDYFASKELEIKKGKHSNFFDESQYAKLTCPEPNADVFDILLLIKLLTHFKLSPVQLVRLQRIRNKMIGHKPRAKLITQEFESLWNEVENILLNIARNISGEEEQITKAKIVELKQKVLDAADTEIQKDVKRLPIVNKKKDQHPANRQHTLNAGIHQKRVPPRDSNVNNECQPMPGPVLKGDDQVYQKCVHDGRLIHLEPAQLETVKENVPDEEIGKGGFGEVRLIKSGVLLDIQMVLKTIKCGPDDADKVKSVTNEKLSARIMHFAVVPLIAVAENTLEENGKRMIQYHFMSPYLPGGSLLKKIKEDNKNKVKICLYQGDRIRILYHIASAIEYLHTPVNSLRNEVHHRDITSNNIVIDGNNNARLIDFGLAYEIKEGTRPAHTTKLSCCTPGYTGDDNKNFGIVMRELLTGKRAMDKNARALATFTPEEIKCFIRKYLPHIWCNDKKECNNEAIKLNKLSQALCQGKEVKDLSESLWKLLNRNALPMWERKGDPNKCEVCMVNPTAPDTLRKGKCNSKHIQVCIACLRNSYLNPIKCHTCRKVLKPLIGYQWGALLIAGGASGPNKEEAKTFYGDVLALKKILVSKSPLIMGLNEDNVVTVASDDKAFMKVKLSNTFSSFKTKAVKKLIIYYSGHYSDGFLLNKEGVFSINDLEKEIITLHESGIEKFLIILDCCYAPRLVTPSIIQNKTILICQLNACEPDQVTTSNIDGGIFSKLLCQALRGESVKQECLVTQNQQETCTFCSDFQRQNKQNGYITVANLLKYLQDHFDKYTTMNLLTDAQKPVANYCNVGWKDTVIAYYIDLKMEFTFLLKYGDKQVVYPVLPCEFQENFEQLQVLLFKKFKEVMKLPNLDTTDFKDIIRIIRYEKKCCPTDEINTSEKLISAWNAHWDSLIVTLRDVENITRGRVGLFLPEGQLNMILQIFKVPDQVFTQPNNGYSHTIPVEKDALSDLLESLVDFDNDFLFEIIITVMQEESSLYSHLEMLFPNRLCDTDKPWKDFVCFNLCKKVSERTC